MLGDQVEEPGVIALKNPQNHLLPIRTVSNPHILRVYDRRLVWISSVTRTGVRKRPNGCILTMNGHVVCPVNLGASVTAAQDKCLCAEQPIH